MQRTYAAVPIEDGAKRDLRTHKTSQRIYELRNCGFFYTSTQDTLNRTRGLITDCRLYELLSSNKSSSCSNSSIGKNAHVVEAVIIVGVVK